MTPETTAKTNAILQQLRHERNTTRQSIQQFADKHGVHAATVRSHETGDRAITLAGLIEHAGWFGLEVVLRPTGSQADDAYQRGYDQAVAQVAELFGLPVDAEAMRRHNEPRPAVVDWDKALDDAYAEVTEETTGLMPDYRDTIGARDVD